MKRFWSLLIITTLACCSQAKFISMTIPSSKISSSSGIFLGKAAASSDFIPVIWTRPDTTIGEVVIINMRIAVYDENTFERYYENRYLTCAEKLNQSFYTIPITVMLYSYHPASFGGIPILNLPKGQHKMLYFTLMDCDMEVRTQSRGEWNLILDLKLANDNSHLTPMDYYIYIYKIILLLVMGLLGAKYAKPVYQEIRKEHFETNYAFVTMAAGFLIKVVSIMLDVLETRIYSTDGTDSPVINFFAKATDLVSGYILACLILFLANGWTIFFSRIDDMELFLPISIALGIMKVLVLGLMSLVRTDQNHFHSYTGVMGIFVTVLHICLFVYYWFLLDQNHAKIQTTSDKKAFYSSLTTLAIFYLMSFPVFYFLSFIVSSVYVSAFIEFGVTTCQLGATLAMGVLIGTGGKYGKIADFDFSLPSSGKANHRD